MSRNDSQLLIRTSREVADRFRLEARQRGLSLGETLLTLIEDGAGGTEGFRLPVSGPLAGALRAVAAQRGIPAQELLLELLGGEVRLKLERMAADLPLPATHPSASTGPAPVRDTVLPQESPRVWTGRDLAAWRRREGLSLRGFAEALGMSYSAVHKAERQLDKPLAPRLQAAVSRSHGS